MRLRWTGKAVDDLARLHAFLAPVSPDAASRILRMLSSAPERLLDLPRMGERLDEFAPREVRRIVIAHYELRYELHDETLIVLRVWHTREDR